MLVVFYIPYYVKVWIRLVGVKSELDQKSYGCLNNVKINVGLG